MRCLLVSVLALVAVVGTATADFIDTYPYEDGSFPPEWTWTGDPRGGGVFEIHDETFVHTEGGHVHFFRDLEVCGAGTYEFDVTDTYWSFAWRITPDNPDVGKCLCVYHNDYWGWAFNFVEFDWDTLPGYPDGQYMWHNGWHTVHSQVDAAPPIGWHHVRIEDTGSHVKVWFDDELLFDRDFTPILGGYVGLGCSWADPMTPAFDNVSFTAETSPVHEATWTAIKALHR